jgi:S1-C subfamily serine protease
LLSRKYIFCCIIFILFLSFVYNVPELFAYDIDKSPKKSITIVIDNEKICDVSEFKISNVNYYLVDDFFSCLNKDFKVDSFSNIITSDKINLVLKINSNKIELRGKKINIPDEIIKIKDKILIPTSLMRIIYPNVVVNKRESIVLINTKMDVEHIAKERSGVMIKTYDKSKNHLDSGSGVLVSAKGLVITSNHVVEGDAHIEVILFDNKVYNATILKSIKEFDISILKIEHNNTFPYATMADSNVIKSGQRVVTISSPLSLLNTVTEGIISSPNRKIGEKNLIQISAPVYHGSSGGGIFNLHGELIGIITNGIDNAANINFGVPINVIKKHIE